MTTPTVQAVRPPPAESYWAASRRPLTSLVFISPLLVIYESGVLLLGHHAVRNGADAWMRQWLDMLGFGQYFLLPILTVCILLAWHYVTRAPWRVSRSVLCGMAGESMLLAMALQILLRLQALLMQLVAGSPPLSIADLAGTLTGYLGAGIYEELLFRLILLSLVIGLLRWLGADRRWRLIGAVVITSLLFSIAHHVGPYGEPFTMFKFVFRFLAGAFFSVLFLYRGFGIAVGAHAGYDVLVGLSLP